jgi:hypothetical protein
MSDSTQEFEYDVALSFAGEDRVIAEKLADQLTDRGVRVFYDRYEQAKLWGKDLYQHLQTVYRDKARYCIIFTSRSYAEKLWTKHELRQAQARAFEENREYILPLRLDNTTIPGVNHTVGYIDLHEHTVGEIALLICRKLWGDDEDAFDRISWKGDMTIYNGVEMTSFWPKRIERAQEIEEYEALSRVGRVRYGSETHDWRAYERPCHDCAAIMGQFHVPGCDVEECPICHHQLISCGCDVLWEQETT